MTSSTHSLSTFASYKAVDSGKSLEKVLSHVNQSNYSGYGPDLWLGGAGKVIVGTPFDYRQLLAGLSEIPSVEFVSHRRLLAEELPTDRVRVSIRHDVDSDIIAGLQQARIEQEFGAEASWYLLHTAAYYGEFIGRTFHRNECMESIYLEMQELGHEVALHTDPLWIYQEHGVDGADAVRTEIEWLRNIGLDIRGTVAHNSKPVYNAWNYEVFKGRYDYRDTEQAEPDFVEKNGITAPLRTLCEAQLGLEYEGNDALHHPDIPHLYGATRAVNRWRWVPHQKRVLSGEVPDDTQFVDQERMLNECREARPGQAVILVVHPCYYGARADASAEPPHRLTRCSMELDRTTGMPGWTPGEMVSMGGPENEPQEYQAISMANKQGMLDAPTVEPGDENTRIEISLLGGHNFDGACVQSRIQLQGRIRERWAERDLQMPRILKLAFPTASPDALFHAWKHHGRKDSPSIVMLGVGADLAARMNQIENQHEPPPPAGKEELDLLRLPADQLEPGQRVRRDQLRSEIVQVALAIKESSDLACLVLEDAGERGLRKDALRDQAHADVKEFFQDIADEIGMELIDPYALFKEAGEDGLECFYSNGANWNATAHRIAGDLLSNRILAWIEATGDESLLECETEPSSARDPLPGRIHHRLRRFWIARRMLDHRLVRGFIRWWRFERTR
ncbi:MAG: hypothetical protein CMJ36_00270 [Phycisphaerae bacterium]|nr:hypothetical protein [Phycisphaerae bacterium]